MDRLFAFVGAAMFIGFIAVLIVKINALPLNIVFGLVILMMLYDFWNDLRPKRGDTNAEDAETRRKRGF